MAKTKIIYVEPDTIVELRICHQDLYGANAQSWKEQSHKTTIVFHVTKQLSLDVFNPMTNVSRCGVELVQAKRP